MLDHGPQPDQGPPPCQWPSGVAPRETEAFELGGQHGWLHDDGDVYGYFHTYDDLQVCGPADAPRKAHVLLPRDYTRTEHRYPVIYMNDGGAAFWPGAFGTWGAQHVLSALDPCQIEPVIIVALHPLARDREYTHTPWHDDRDCCGLPAYADYLADCVKPWIDAQYRTDAHRAATLGSSHGGLAAFYTAARRSDAFSAAIAMSPSIWAGVDYNRQATATPLAGAPLMEAVHAGLREAPPTLWLDWGLVRTGGEHNETIEARATERTRELAAHLQEAYGYTLGDTLYAHEDPTGGHDEASWGRRLPLALRALFPRR
jgi:predicted alpha/beta superfamily hydrolase